MAINKIMQECSPEQFLANECKEKKIKRFGKKMEKMFERFMTHRWSDDVRMSELKYECMGSKTTQEVEGICRQ